MASDGDAMGQEDWDIMLGASAHIADGIMDSLRQTVENIGMALDSPEGQVAVRDSAEARSLPALSKVLRRLWFATPLDSAEPPSAFGPADVLPMRPPPGADENKALDQEAGEQQVQWLAQLLLISEASRDGKLSFYDAGVWLCDTLQPFLWTACCSIGMQLDTRWLDCLESVRSALNGPFGKALRCMSADRLCSCRVKPLLSTNQLPAPVRRMFDLEGHKLTKVQAAGLGVAMLMPGSGIAAFGGLGAMMLVKQVNKQKKASQVDAEAEIDPLKEIRTQCVADAKLLLKRKTWPIEVSFQLPPGVPVAPKGTPQKVKVCVYPCQQGWLRSDILCAIPAGAFSSEGGGIVQLSVGERVQLRPQGKTDDFFLRVFKPGLMDVVIHDGVQVKRGSQLVITPAPGGLVRCYVPSNADPDVPPPPTSLPPAQVEGTAKGIDTSTAATPQSIDLLGDPFPNQESPGQSPAARHGETEVGDGPRDLNYFGLSDEVPPLQPALDILEELHRRSSESNMPLCR